MTAAPTRRRDFRLLWAGQAVSQLGSRGFHIACLLWVVAMTGSPVQAGLAGSVMLGASTLVALPGGWLADRVDRRRLMMGCDVASGGATLSLAAAAFADVYSLPHLLVVGVILGVGWGVRGTAEAVSVPEVVTANELPDAVALTEARSHGVGLAGPPLGAALFSLAPGLPFLLDALSYLTALVCTASMRTSLRPATPSEHNPLRELRAGLAAFWRLPFVRVTAALTAVNELVVASTVLLVIIQLRESGSSSLVIGLVVAAGSLGGLLGAVVTPRLLRVVSPPALLATLPALGAGSVLTALTAPAAAVVGAAFGVLMMVLAIWDAFLAGRWLAVTDAAVRGRVLSTAGLVATVPAIGAPLASGVVLEVLGLQSCALILAGMLVVVALLAGVSAPVREHSLPVGAGEACPPAVRVP